MNFSVEERGLSSVDGGLSKLLEAGNESVWVVGTEIRYAVFVEMGTYKDPAQPYLRPAINEVMGDADRLTRSAQSADHLAEMIAENIASRARRYAPVRSGDLRDSISAQRVG